MMQTSSFYGFFRFIIKRNVFKFLVYLKQKINIQCNVHVYFVSNSTYVNLCINKKKIKKGNK